MSSRTIFSLFLTIGAVLAGLTSPVASFAQSKDLKIAHIYSKTGPLEAYGKQTK